MKKYLIMMCFLLVTSAASAAPISEDYKESVNEVIQEIYDEVNDLSVSYPELSKINPVHLDRTDDGILTIEYEYYDEDRGESTYKFSVTAVGLKTANPYGRGGKAFESSYKLLGLKVVGFVDRKFSGQYDIKDLILTKVRKLSLQQQAMIPYELTLTSLKSQYKVREPIEFVVRVTNKTRQNLKLRNLTRKTLHFSINDRKWGTRELDSKEARKVRPEILGPGEYLEKTFKGRSFIVPKKVKIVGTYSLPYKGVLAEGELEIEIIDEENL